MLVEGGAYVVSQFYLYIRWCNTNYWRLVNTVSLRVALILIMVRAVDNASKEVVMYYNNVC